MANNLEYILHTIRDATSFSPVVKGGASHRPIEYTYSRLGERRYRLELDLIGTDVTVLLSLQDTIDSAICDFADNTKFNNMSITHNGGGLVGVGSSITQVAYYDIIYFDDIEYIQPVYPEGTYDIIANGTYDIASYESVDVNVPGGGDPYTGSYEITPKVSQQTMPTRNKTMTDDVTIFQIPYESVPNPQGTTVVIGIE